MPEIIGYDNGSILNADVGTPLTLVCRADHGDSPFGLTWTIEATELNEETRYSGVIIISSDTINNDPSPKQRNKLSPTQSSHL